MDSLGTLLPLVLIGIAFYFLILRPQKARQRAQDDMRRGLQPGAEVMTTAGVFGTIAYVSDDEIGVEVAPGTIIRHLPAAIAKVNAPAPAAQQPVDPDAPLGDAS